MPEVPKPAVGTIIEVPKPSKEFKSLKRDDGWFNPHTIWEKHPSQPCMAERIHGFGDEDRWRIWVGKGYPRYVANMEAYEKALAAYEADAWRRNRPEPPKKLGKKFASWEDALAWVQSHLGFVSLEYVRVNGIGGWFGSQNPEWVNMRPCHQGGGTDCEKPAVTILTTKGWYASDGKEHAACKFHSTVQQKRDERHQEYVQRREEEERRDAENERKRKVAEDQAALLRGKGFHVPGTARINGGWEPVLNGETLIALVERYELACRELGVEFAEEIEELTKGGRA